MTNSECPAFTKVIDNIKQYVTKPRQPFDPNSRALQEALTKLTRGGNKEPWLAFLLEVALNRRKYGTAESPDGLVFTATQLHNYLNQPENQFGIPCPYQDAVFLALFLSGETKMKHTLESVKHFYGKVIYDEDDEEEEEEDDEDDSDAEEDDSDSDWEGEAIETDEEEEMETDEKPTGVAPVEEKPAEETPIEEKPAEEAPVEEKPAEEAPVEEKPAEEAPGEDLTGQKREREAPATEPTPEENSEPTQKLARTD